jgi:hypothetical protein
MFRVLERFQKDDYQAKIAQAVARHSARTVGTAVCMYDVTTLHFQTDNEDGFRQVEMSKEHQVDQQIQVGLLVDRIGAPLEVKEFAGNKAESTTLMSVLTQF